MVRLGPLSAHVRERLARLLDERRVVVWYDSERAFGDDFLKRLDLATCKIVSATRSDLIARREAEAFYRHVGEPTQLRPGPENLLIYVPRARGTSSEAKQEDPFEGFAMVGAAFGDQPADRLDSLARVALKDRLTDVERLFRESRPSVEMLDNLRTGERFPLLRQVLGTDNGVELAATLLSREETSQRLAGTQGALEEAQRLFHAELGLPEAPTSASDLVQRVAQYLLASELAFDLPDGLPPALAGVPHADDTQREQVLAACTRWRETEHGRESYITLARQIERDLHLAAVLGPDSPIGSHDTFPIEASDRLKAIDHAVENGEIGTARTLFDHAKNSPWRRESERQLIWRATERCIEFLELADEWTRRPQPKSASVADFVTAYVAGNGLWRVDRAQRFFEHTAARCAQDEEIDRLVHVCRHRYRAVVDQVQAAFQSAVQAQGWPPEGTRSQRATFTARVAPELESRRRTAFFLVDAFRYEMGRELGESLEDFGTVTVDAAANVLPTTTPCGMAALMPGAETAFEYILASGDLVPVVAGTQLSGAAERIAYLRKHFGDRYYDLTLEEILSTAPKKLGQRIGSADFVVVRTQDIDSAGEGPSLFRARKVMSEVLGELRVASQRLMGLGYQTLVFSGDHGHVLLPEIPPGDVLTQPPGDWKARKRRSLIGRSTAPAPGVMIFSAAHVGIVGPPELADFAAATGFKTFQAGEGYFHEGLSLQECIVPVVVLWANTQLASAASTNSGSGGVIITYRSNRFTSSVVGLKLMLTSASMFSENVAIRLEAYDGREARANIVGHAADCEAYDPRTREVRLRPGEETQVPLVVDPDFTGASIDIRATDPRTGVILGRLSLKNGRME